MHWIKELREIASVKLIAKALEMTKEYIVTLTKAPKLTDKVNRKLDNLSYTEVTNTENYKLTIILEAKHNTND